LKRRIDESKNEWQYVILPRNLLDDQLKNTMNKMFGNLYAGLAREPKRAKNLCKFELNELKDNLVLAMLLSGFDLVVSNY